MSPVSFTCTERHTNLFSACEVIGAEIVSHKYEFLAVSLDFSKGLVLCSSAVLGHIVIGDCLFSLPQDHGQNIGKVFEKVATNVSNEEDKTLTMPAAAAFSLAGTVVSLMRWWEILSRNLSE